MMRAYNVTIRERSGRDRSIRLRRRRPPRRRHLGWAGHQLWLRPRRAPAQLTGACWEPTCTLDYATWTYDPAGNRLTEATPAGTTTYAYNTADQLTATTGPAGTTTYAYDARGNLTADAARTYTWDLANRLTTLTTTAGTTTYTYDPGGLRTSATGPAGTTHTLWDPLHATPQVALETTGTGALVHRDTYGLGRLNQATPTATSWNLPDTRGTLLAQTSATGTLERTWSHDPWGTIRTSTNPAPQAPTNTNTYTGEATDPTGLTYLRARYYDPTLGRFLTTDPIHQPATTPYSYTNNQPTVFVDPTGLLPCLAGRHEGGGCRGGSLIPDAASDTIGQVAKFGKDHFWELAGLSAAGACMLLIKDPVHCLYIAGALTAGKMVSSAYSHAQDGTFLSGAHLADQAWNVATGWIMLIPGVAATQAELPLLASLTVAFPELVCSLFDECAEPGLPSTRAGYRALRSAFSSYTDLVGAPMIHPRMLTSAW